MTRVVQAENKILKEAKIAEKSHFLTKKCNPDPSKRVILQVIQNLKICRVDYESVIKK